MATRLNGALFEADQDSYFQAIVALGEDPTTRPKAPQAVRDVGITVMTSTFQRVGWGKLLSKYGQVLVESMVEGYTVTISEDWSDLDRTEARRLSDVALRAAQETRTKTGAEQISLDNVNNRLTVMTQGLMAEAPESIEIRTYLFALPAYQRVQHFAPLLLKAGEAMAKVKGRHAAAFEQANDYAWKIGVGLGLLDMIGEVPHHDRWMEPAQL
jgi:hypothetical protein